MDAMSEHFAVVEFSEPIRTESLGTFDAVVERLGFGSRAFSARMGCQDDGISSGPISKAPREPR